MQHTRLSLEDYELVGVLSLKLADEFNEVAVTVLAKVLGAQIHQLILGLDVVDADLALLHQLLRESTPAQCALREDCRYGCQRRAVFEMRSDSPPPEQLCYVWVMV